MNKTNFFLLKTTFKHTFFLFRSAIREVVFPAQEGDVICPGCNGKIFDAEKLLTQYGPFHTACFKCLKCEKSLVSSPAFKLEGEGEGLTLACKQCSQAEPSKTSEVIAKGKCLPINTKNNVCARYVFTKCLIVRFSKRTFKKLGKQ